MIGFNIGSYAVQLMKMYPITRSTQTYNRGVIERTILPPEMIMAHVQPRRNSSKQKMEKNSDRVVGQITIFTLIEIDLTRQSDQATTLTYKGNEYFMTGERDWSDYGYFQYFAELIIPQSTG